MLDKINNIDVYFRTGCENLHFDLNKEKAWEKLNQKRNKKTFNKFSIAASIVILAGIISGNIFQTKQNVIIPNEAFKRMKLEEYERKMAGTYIEPKICYDCNGSVLLHKNNEAPENQYIQNLY